MAGNLLAIGKSGLFAAQVGLSTTGHNIANANVAGYSRQGVVQGAGAAQNSGAGFVGSGTEVLEIKRFTNSFLDTQVRSATTAKSALDSYYAQISQVDNMLADTTAGLSPSMQDFFKGVQEVSANPGSTAARETLLSNANSLATRFQSLNSRLTEVREGVNAQIESSVSLINSYAGQIANLNDKISGFVSTGQGLPNDLMDQRDQLIVELNTQIKATVVAGSNNTVTVSIGNGQPLVVGNKPFELALSYSPTDQTRLQVGYVSGGKVGVLSDTALSGGALGGLFDFRANTLDPAQSALGRLAVGIAVSFNDQHKLGQDQNGALGEDFFTVGQSFVGANANNNVQSDAEVSAIVTDPSALKASDYKVGFDNGKYVVTRLSDNQATVISPYPQTAPQTIDGIDFKIEGSSADGDSFLVRPTYLAASQFGVGISDRSKIAAGAPVLTSAPIGNKGNAVISEASVNQDFRTPANQALLPYTLTKVVGGLSGFPAGLEIRVQETGKPDVVHAAGTSPVPFKAGATYVVGGVQLRFSGAAVDADTYTVGKNIDGSGDNRNARLLGALQTKGTLDGGKTTYLSAYAELVSFVGNKTREVQINGDAAETMLKQARTSQQSVSGVNLDEEAANLIRYQQAYQAAGKVMQTAAAMFDSLLRISL